MYKLNELGESNIVCGVCFPVAIATSSFENSGVYNKYIIGLKLDYVNHKKEFSIFTGVFRLSFEYFKESNNEYFNEERHKAIRGYVTRVWENGISWGEKRSFRLQDAIYCIVFKNYYGRSVGQYTSLWSVDLFVRCLNKFRPAEVKKKWSSFPIERYLQSAFAEQ